MKVQFSLFFFFVAPSSSPRSIRLASVNSTSINTTWAPPPVPEQNGAIREYRINLTEVNTGTVFNFSFQELFQLFTELHPYYTYEIVVAAVTVAVGPYSIPVQIITPEDSKSLSGPRHQHFCNRAILGTILLIQF